MQTVLLDVKPFQETLHGGYCLQDPEIGKLRQIARDDFLKVWFDFTGKYINSWDEMIIRQLIVITVLQ